MQLFITGTDTEIGKTYFAAWLVRQWRKLGLNAAALKPVSSGGTEDAAALIAAGNYELSLDEVNPLRFPSPVAPGVATIVDDMPFDWELVNRCVATARQRFTHLAIEAVGGWLVPLDGKILVREWATQLKMPVVVVARAGLGTINHTLLTIESIQRAGLPIAGVVLNAGLNDPFCAKYRQAYATNAQTLEGLISHPIFVFNPVTEAGSLPEWLTA